MLIALLAFCTIARAGITDADIEAAVARVRAAEPVALHQLVGTWQVEFAAINFEGQSPHVTTKDVAPWRFDPYRGYTKLLAEDRFWLSDDGRSLSIRIRSLEIDVEVAIVGDEMEWVQTTDWGSASWTRLRRVSPRMDASVVRPPRPGEVTWRYQHPTTTTVREAAVCRATLAVHPRGRRPLVEAIEGCPTFLHEDVRSTLAIWDAAPTGARHEVLVEVEIPYEARVRDTPASP